METFLYCFFVTLLNKNISWWSFPNELREIYIFLAEHFWENAFVFNWIFEEALRELHQSVVFQKQLPGGVP